jgi:16S rRNA (uracil1498-N3)-methyltransferase
MNLCLVRPEEYIDESRFILRGARKAHVAELLGMGPGDQFYAGAINGLKGMATVLSVNEDDILCQAAFHQPPSSKPDVELIVALPRPKMLKRMLRTSAELGVRRIVLLNTWKVEKSYWQSPFLAEDVVREQLLLGLEQAVDTVLPEVIMATRFKPFVEDDLPSLLEDREGWLAHPGVATACPSAASTPRTLLIGPEGGFTPYEVEKLIAAGCKSFHLGARILRVETAVTTCIAKLIAP